MVFCVPEKAKRRKGLVLPAPLLTTTDPKEIDMATTAVNTATRLPAIPVASLSPAMREAVECYLAAHRAKHDGAEDDASLSAKVDASEAAGATIAATPARNVADLTAKLIIGVHELEPEYPDASNLYCLFESFPTQLSAELLRSACFDAAVLALDTPALPTSWDDALTVYRERRSLSDQSPNADELTDSYCEAMDHLIANVPAPNGEALAIKLELLCERYEGFQTPDSFYAAVAADARRMSPRQEAQQ